MKRQGAHAHAFAPGEDYAIHRGERSAQIIVVGAVAFFFFGEFAFAE